MDLLAYLLGGGCLLLGAGIGAWFRFGPGARVGAVADAILGSPAVTDRSGGTLDPGNPGLVHRVAQVEEAVVEFRHMTGLLTEVLKRTDLHEHELLATKTRLAEHDSAIAAIIAHTFDSGAQAALQAERLKAANRSDREAN